MFDGKAFGEQMVEVVRSYVDDATAPLMREIEALKAQVAKAGPAGADGRDGIDGKDCDMDAVMARVDEALKSIPAPAAGKDGRDGVDGKDGTPGDKGADGRDGRDCDMDIVLARVEALVKAIPAPKDGKDGNNGDIGKPGERGLDGKDGRDGVGLAGAMIDRDGVLNLTLANGEVKTLGRVVGTDGQNGERGPDGFSLKDFDTEFRHDDKVLVMKFDGGSTIETHEIFLPYVRDCGVWKEGSEYLQGDGVTWAGSFWTAQKTTDGKPDTGGDDWRLAVKRGRDAKPVTV